MRKALYGLVAGCAGATLAGYLLALQVPIADRETQEDPQRGATGTNHPGGQDEHHQGASAVTIRTPQQLAAAKKGLTDLFATSPSPERDWALRAQASAILATLSAEELEDFATELAPTDEAWGELRWTAGTRALFKEIHQQWGLKDPENACLSTEKGMFLSTGRIFHDWLRRDPEAARAWVTRGQFPPGKEKQGAILRQQFVNGQALTDLSSARESLALLDTEAQQKTLLAWSVRLAHDPAKRDEFLALLASRGDAEFSQKCHERLVGEMASKSPREAYEFIEGTSLPDEQKHALSQQMLGVWAEKDPHKAFAAWAELKETEAPAPLLGAMDDWSLNSPGAEQAIEWVNKLEAGPAREQFKKHMLQRMSNMDRFNQAADLAGSLDDPAERIRQLKLVKRQWDEGRPQGAQEWFNKLPEADKEAILK